jgi:hypothetical protein
VLSGPHERSIDLKWLSDAELLRRSGSEPITQQAYSNAAPALQPALAAVIGLAGLMRGDPFEESYAELVDDLQLYFGFPPSLQAELRWHFEEMMRSPMPEHHIPDILLQKKLPGRTHAYWTVLRRILSANPSIHRQDYSSHRYFDSQLEAQNKRRRGSSS